MLLFLHQFLMKFICEMDVLGSFRQMRDCRNGQICSQREQLHMEEMYEVLKFIEHGNHCRQSLDCVQGTILMRYLREHPRLDKSMLFSWFRELALCVDQYHRARNRQNYRCLNPCSIVVTEEGRLLLLDLEAPDNARAIKQMQRGAVRNHFVKPVYEIGVSKSNEADLFAYGKTIQFMLAYTEVYPPLTRWEEIRLEKLISRCTGEARNKCEDFQQVLRSLPLIPKEKSTGRVSVKRILSGVAVGSVSCLTLCVLLGIGKSELTESANVRAESSAVSEMSEADQRFAELMREKDELEIGRAAERIVWETEKAAPEAFAICAMYEDSKLEEELLRAYESLLQYETDGTRVEEIGLKKMELEEGRGDYEQAVLTGEMVLGKIQESEKITERINECKIKGTGD